MNSCRNYYKSNTIFSEITTHLTPNLQLCSSGAQEFFDDGLDIIQTCRIRVLGGEAVADIIGQLQINYNINKKQQKITQRVDIYDKTG